MSIRVVISNGAALVWNAEDVRTLRDQHRIMGSLIGSHPRAPYQNSHLSLPLRLMSEEVTLLRDKGLVTLVDGQFDAGSVPSNTTVDDYHRYKQQQYQQQDEAFQREREATEEKFREQIDEGRSKRRERAERKGAPPTDGGAAPAGEGAPAGKPMTENHMMVQLFHEEPWTRSETLSEWRYPMTSQERLRYAVYRDLWEQGFYLTSGSKFGGDFLVYPGDPLMFHSYHVAICVTEHRRLSASELVTMGRLGSNVRKTVLLCSVREREDTEETPEDTEEAPEDAEEALEDTAEAVEDVTGGTEREEGEEEQKDYSHDHKARSVRYLTLEWTGIG